MSTSLNKTILNKTIEGLNFVCTCRLSPEQYDVYLDGVKVGYVRVRWGAIRVDYPICGGETVYYSDIIEGYGDLTDEERQKELTKAARAILKAYQADKEDEGAR